MKLRLNEATITLHLNMMKVEGTKLWAEQQNKGSIVYSVLKNSDLK
jgi:hypothetical protein